MNAYYELGEEELTIKSGIGKGTKVSFDQILSASGTKSPISASALSMDRLEIKFRSKSGEYSDSVIISPKDKEGFIRLLKEKNNNIEISTEKKPMAKGHKVLLYFTGVILVASGVMVLAGMQDPSVNINDDRIVIGGMYGISISFSEMTSISLIEKSMREIYGGDSSMRTNGFGGIGQANKGHFHSARFGAHRLYVQARTAPTIHIERSNGDVFISFRDGKKTEKLYREINAAMAQRRR